MTAKGVTVRELTRKAGVSHQAIYSILKDENHRPHNTTVKKLADYFGVSPSYLLTGEEAATAPAATIEARVAALEAEVRCAPGPLPPGRRRELEERYVLRGLVAFRLAPGTKIDAAGWDKLYKILDQLDREFAEEDDVDSGGPET